MVCINIGNFPPQASAVIKLTFHSQLEIEDLSYCLRIPITYIPKYYGDMQRYLGSQYKG